MEYFVAKGSIVRKIWGRPDTVLFIFAGAAAEFALNKAVDWLYFTGRLPADPLGRLFSTVTYSQRIIFSELKEAHRAIDQITSIHKTVEANRHAQIPDWAYRDVLFMLIYYSITTFELLYSKLSAEEKQEVFDVFYRVGDRMGLKGLPANYEQWLVAHEQHLQHDLAVSDYTFDLYKQYRKHLGYLRYVLVKQVQAQIAPAHVNKLLHLGKPYILRPLLAGYKLVRSIKLDKPLTLALLPQKYKSQLKTLNVE